MSITTSRETGQTKRRRDVGQKIKAEFQILKKRPKIEAVLTRDSVCAGDDCDAPHEKKIEIHSLLDPEAFANAASMGCLPSVMGTGHSWICTLNGAKIAEIRTTGIKPLVRETLFSEDN